MTAAALRAREVGALTRRWMVMLRRDRLALVLSIAQPAVWMVFFGSAIGRTVDPRVVGSGDYLTFALPGVVAFTVVGNGVAGALPLLWDKETGYLDKLMTLPMARSSLLVSRILAQVAVGVAQALAVCAIAAAMHAHVTAPGLAAVLVVTVLLTVATTSASLALAYAVAAHETFFAVTGFVTVPLMFLSTAFVPVSVLPQGLAVIASVNPVSAAVSAMRGALTGDAVASWAGLGITAAVAAACLGVGSAVYRRRTGERC